MTAEAPLLQKTDRLSTVRLFGLLVICVIGGEWLLIAMILLVPCDGCITSTALDGIHNASGLVWAIALGPLAESVVLYCAIKLLWRLTKNISIHCLVCGVVFGWLHAVTDGLPRWIITGFAFAIYTASYFIYQRRSRWPIFPMTALHAFNNLVASSPLIIALVRHNAAQ